MPLPLRAQEQADAAKKPALRGGFSNVDPLKILLEHSTGPHVAGNQAVQRLFRSGAVQPKLAISQPGDPEELEANQTAERVLSTESPPAVQRKCATCAPGAPCPKCKEKIPRIAVPGNPSEILAGPSSQIASLSGGGEPLPASTRAFFEPRFGQDFSEVRVHTDGQAIDAAHSIQARAFTVGRDIALGPGQFAPESTEGKRLLAHELTHVMQQRTQKVAGTGTLQRFWNPFKSKTEREKIDIALKEWKPEYVYEIKDFNRATEDEKVNLIVILLNYDPKNSLAWTAIRTIWGSFGGRLPMVMEETGLIWESSVEAVPGLVELAQVKNAQDNFKKDIMDVAKGHLFRNLDYVTKEKERLGLGDEHDNKPDTANQQPNLLVILQIIANEIFILKQKQKQLLDFPVYTDMRESPILFTPDPVKFNPFKRPPPGTDIDRKWDDIKEHWDMASQQIAAIASRYPWLFSLLRDEKGESELSRIAKVSPELLGNQIKGTLDGLISRIKEVDSNLAENINWFDLVPIREQLLNGLLPPSNRNWGAGKKLQTFNHWAAQEAVKDREIEEWWKEFFLQTATEVALITVTLATGGAAPLLAGLIGAAVAVGIPATQSIIASSEAEKLAQVSNATVLPETGLVSQAQVDEKNTKALSKALEAFINAIMVSASFIGLGKRMLLRPKDSEIASKVVSYHLTQSSAMKSTESVLAKEGTETISIFFNSESKEYAVIKGEQMVLRQRLEKEWLFISRHIPLLQVVIVSAEQPVAILVKQGDALASYGATILDITKKAETELKREIEVGLFQNTKTAEYAVVLGEEGSVGKRLANRQDWFALSHYHPKTTPAHRLPSWEDFKIIERRAITTQQEVTSFITYIEKNEMHFSEYTYKPGAEQPYIIKYLDKDGMRQRQSFKTLEDFLRFTQRRFL